MRLRISHVGMAAVLVAAWTGAAARAGGSRILELDDFRRVEGLRLEGASLSADGGVFAAPSLEALLGPSVEIVWDVVAVPGGGVHAVAGAPSALLSLPARGSPPPPLSLGDGEAVALAVRPAGALAVALSPGGRLVEIDRDGRMRDLAAIGSRYVWDLLAGPGGVLYVATGDPGAVISVDPEGRSRLLADLGREQVRCLAWAADGSLLFGTAGSGRIEAVRDGRRRVLHDSEAEEVVAVAAGPDGAVFAALAAAGAADVSLPAGEDQAVGRQAPPTPPQPASPAPPAAEPAWRSRVVRIRASGEVERLWASDRDVALCLLPRPDGSLWIGTGSRGAIHRVRADGRGEIMLTLGSRAVTSLVADGDSVLAATAGLGGLTRIRQGRSSPGIATGPVLDAGPGARFGAIEWWGRTGEPTGIALSLRSGNSAEPDATWTPWSGWQSGGRSASPAAPDGRFLQWRARVEPDGVAGAVPELARLRLGYLPANRAPRVQRVEVLPPGVVLDMPQAPPGQLLPPPGSSAAQVVAPDAGASFRAPRRQWSPGKRTLVWDAADDDGDALRALVMLRGDADSDFTRMGEAGESSFFVFDESELADGGYVLRVEVSDAGANAAGRGRMTAADSPRFVIDRTPPIIDSLKWQAAASGGTLRCRVLDGQGPPAAVRVILDGGEPVPLLPVDGVGDSREEHYLFEVDALGPGPHALTVTAEDAMGNAASARLVVGGTTQEKARR